MKTTFTILFLILLTPSFVRAQLPENYEPRSQAVGNERMREMVKQRIRDEAKLNEAQADSVLKIQYTYQTKLREMQKKEALKEDERKNKVNELYLERNRKIKEILTEEQFSKIQVFYEKLKKMRDQVQTQNKGAEQ